MGSQRDGQKYDIANAFSEIYRRTSAKVLREIYRTINAEREKALREVVDPVYLIVGPGNSVTPDAWRIENDRLAGTNRDLISSQMGNGRLLLMDYSIEGLRKSMETLYQLGFFAPGYFIRSPMISQRRLINPRQLLPKSITPIYGDLRDSLKIEKGTVDFIVASAAAHHTTPSQGRAIEVYRGIYSIARPRGTFVLAEGDVSMSDWTEKKALSLAEIFAEIEGNDVYVFDERDRVEERLRIHRIEKGTDYQWLPSEVVRQRFSGMTSRLEIVGDGTLKLSGKTAPAELAKELKKEGYKTLYVGTDCVVLPTRDTHLSKDLINLVKLSNFYSFIGARTYEGEEERTCLEALEAIGKERNSAINDQVEFYRSRENTKLALEEAGWKSLEFIVDESTPFYTAVAKKLEILTA